MSKVTRVIHIRPPLMVKSKIDGRLCTPTFIPDKMSRLGGATVLLTGDRESGKVEMQVTFCRPDEGYSRKLGRQQAALKEKEVVDVTEIPRELLDIEHQMLCQYSRYLQKHAHERSELTRGGGYAYAMYLFLPKTPIEQQQ